MKIGIIDADLLDNGTRHPNLALMKISGYYKKNGHNVELIIDYKVTDNYDKIFISKVFTFTNIPQEILELPNIKIGGTGFFEDGGESLPDEIEHQMPDYNLYNEYIKEQIKKGKNKSRFTDYLNYSIGFTTRGCFRKCDFCVNKKYDQAFRHSHVEEFHDTSKPYIYLWDDNVLAYSGWEDVLDELEETGKPFQFRQGLDLRLMTHRKAKRFANTKYHGDFIFAFDHIEDREIIEKKLRLWKRYCSKTTKLYVLCGYDSQDEVDIINTFERIKVLMKYGCLPYIMRYVDYLNSEYKNMYIQIARWCNQPQFFKKKSFRQFCLANQQYHKNKKTYCAAYQTMMDFEDRFPEIAKEYFDLRYDEENEYSNLYGYGRKYANKPDCDECIAEQNMWLESHRDNYCNGNLIYKYFTKEIDLQCLTYRSIKCWNKEISINDIAKSFSAKLLNTEIIDIIDDIKLNRNKMELILPSNIPQYSNIYDAIFKVIDILDMSGEKNTTFSTMGYYLDGKDKNDVARKKYGENHSKFAALIDLTVINVVNNANYINISVLGKAFLDLENKDKEQLILRLILRIPIIQNILIDAMDEQIDVIDYMDGLAYKTRVRRKPNIVDILNYIKKRSPKEMDYIFKNIKGM